MLELADTIGALPRTAGVLLIYADRGRFGFDLWPAYPSTREPLRGCDDIRPKSLNWCAVSELRQDTKWGRNYAPS